MKNIVQQFREVLKAECLNKTEKKYLNSLLYDFLKKREIISRQPIDSQIDVDFNKDWVQNNIG